MKIFESKNGMIEWSDDHKAVIKSFSGFIKGKELQKIFTSGLEVFAKNGGQTWISDNRKLRAYTEEDISWINTVWLPKMLDAGWKYWALIEPVSNIGKSFMRHFQFYIDKGIEVKAFTDREDAERWALNKL